MKFMQSVILAIMGMLFCCPIINANEHDAKVYIPKDAIELTENGIFVVDGNDLLPIGNLYTDNHGLYTYDIKFIEKRKFYCSKCRDYHSNSWECPYWDPGIR